MQAVLFDLDGTLLDIDIDGFIRRYFAALAVTIESVLPPGSDIAHAMATVGTATSSMMEPHQGRTNRAVFNEVFERHTGIDLAAHQDALDAFYDDVFPTLRDGIGPTPAAREAVVAARSAGLRVVVATNPIFPARAIEHRMSWAGIALDDVDYVTTYEHMEACKPHPQYFRQTAALIDTDPARCLMVGDDRDLDMPAAAVGMRTFYVGTDRDARADFRGTLRDLVRLIDGLSAS
jgi:FMN phosphatase YigB (HAD superfamily)